MDGSSYQRSAFSFQRVENSYQRTAVSHQLSAFGFQEEEKNPFAGKGVAFFHSDSAALGDVTVHRSN